MVKLINYNEDNLKWLIKLNNACVPAVNPLTETELSYIIEQSDFCMIAYEDKQPLGAVILLREGKAVTSKNYAWHSAKSDKHLYVDRIIISEQARGLGIGRQLYEFAFNAAKQQSVPLTAEVNTIPDNPQSHAFHEKLGFKIIGEITHEPDYAVKFYKYEN
ncbi:MAG: GNAT family N-acetyltransferase [Rhizobiales bacterium]|nr:GNAT family N-acetyltransferase [Hyphomicrobiales bacterium]